MKTLCVLLILLLTGVVFGQDVISAQAGLINYVEGQATLDGEDVIRTIVLYPQVKENSVLKTGAGRVELLLNPGSFLRMSENSSLRMITTRLIDTRLEVLSGTVLVECAELSKDNSVTLVYKDSTITLRKKGLYRLDTEPPQFSVLNGDALVIMSGQQTTLRGGKRTNLVGAFMAEKFDTKDSDAFYRWSRNRAEYLALANISIARSLVRTGFSPLNSRWFWNPWMNLYTFVPYNGFYYSPFGCRYYSTQTVHVAYDPSQQSTSRDWRTGWTPNQLGYSTTNQTSAGTSGVIASTPTISNPPSVSRDSGRAGGAGR